LGWSILSDFYNATGRTDAVETRKTPVSAVAIATFIVVICLILLFKIGGLGFNTVSIVIGALISAFGSIFQIIARAQLGRSWSNQIKIYEHQTLVTTGVYSVIRHPMYATFIVMFLGNALMYSNWLAAVLTIAVFVPMMNFRAKQEEKILCEAFDEYPAYMTTTGRLVPKFGGQPGVGSSVAVLEEPEEIVSEKGPSPVKEPHFWIFYIIAVGFWALGLLLPGYYVLIPLVCVTPYFACGVILWLLFRKRDKPALFGVLLGTMTPFMGMFAVISIGELLNLPW